MWLELASGAWLVRRNRWRSFSWLGGDAERIVRAALKFRAHFSLARSLACTLEH